MLPTQYQSLSRRTAPVDMDVSNIAMGLIGEGGELIDLVKKLVFHNHPMDTALKVKFEKEAGDLLWYFVRALDELDIPIVKEPKTFEMLTLDCAANAPETDLLTDAALLMAYHLGKVCEDVALVRELNIYHLERSFSLFCMILSTLEISLAAAAQTNIIKLSTRYPQGFSTQDSIARVDKK
ncbi:MazG-like pyrophosphatase [Bacillus phage Wes44]|uniref:Nucleoside pyrophosphohydrolase n=1 Tax=Bacillus phage Wes44 TaxID=2283012 RepID=A0A346FK29_9CAUD|nr:MazG-like pyrophosphatase [Bacillus phage Wes44]AXN58334.1 nucleoside pyrophosphohydrolase [Bacillus phage Wes44]